MDIMRKIKGGCKPVLVHTLKVYMGSRDITLLILNLCTIWRRGENFMPWPFYSQVRTPVPTE